MIEKLEFYKIRDQYGNVYREQPPSVLEMMKKINELVDEVEWLRTRIENLEVL